MMKRSAALLLALILMLSLCACTLPSDLPEEIDRRVDALVREKVESMSTEQKLAQMMIVGLRSDANNTRSATALSPAYVELLETYDFGGILLFSGNILDTAQTVRLIRDCQTAARSSAPGIPLLICADQEGGMVNRVSFGTSGPGNMALAAAGDTALTEECAGLLGQELAALGFNLDFAPVSDVNSNPSNPVIGVRAFSDDPELCAAHVTAFLRGLENSGVTGVLKHFPGHGNVGEDSHTRLPRSELSLEELEECDLIPFRAGIAAGADMIMTAHIQYPNIETERYVSRLYGTEISLPATLSRRIVTGLLREELGYDGLVITDALGMDAIADHFDPTDAAVLAINAGVDLLLCPVELYQDASVNTFPAMDAYLRKLLARAEAGDIPEERLDESVSRILRLKYKKGIMTGMLSLSLKEQLALAEAVVGAPEHRAREWEMAQRGLTLLKNEGGLLPLDGKKGGNTLLLVPNAQRRPTVDYALDRLAREKLLDPSAVTVLNYGELWLWDGTLQQALLDADRVLILSQSRERSQVVSGILAQVRQKEGCRAVLLSLHLPYDAACYPEADAILCAYQAYGSAWDSEGNGPFNLNAAAALCAVFGESVPQGRLPVNVPKRVTLWNGAAAYAQETLYERGFGLRDWG